ncbi:MAG: flagellar basal body L-ring protein FlgH [Thiomicrospira sp.]|jgi:flagellar L-ring protein precursor FlgH|nr:flagellar basal body L-ring protein FlgH [Thiomicrospira sp.]
MIGTVRQIASLAAVMVSVALMQGCSTAPERMEQFSYEPSYPMNIAQAAQPMNGSLYQAANAMTLFDDARAHRVGDIITVKLVEKFNAKKKDEAKYDKSNNVDLGVSTPLNILGRSAEQIYAPLGTGGIGFGSNNSFSGKSDVKQDSSITGSVAVTVVEVIPNGNLVVRGEKWITLHDGEEVIRFAGIIRPQDIKADNTIESGKVADVRLIYRDTGIGGDTARPGAVTKFLSKFWPL